MPSVTFVNHASVLIRQGATALLTDPWYRGPAFHKGWRLLTETPDDEAARLLQDVTHIWLSHEHPDHFSIPFFRTHGPALRDRAIPVLFQKIADRRVADFLAGEGIDVREMAFGARIALAPDFDVMCLKDEFYDSLLSVRAGGVHILNLNDCNVATHARAQEILRATGPCDWLLTQFSYAAWKGGPDNRAWRAAAAAAKLDAMAVQIDTFAPKAVIPFASFVTFANAANGYLNDAANRPQEVQDRFAATLPVVVMQPGDRFDGTVDPARTAAAVAFWDRARTAAAAAPPMAFETRDMGELTAAFAGYVARIRRQNAVWLMRAVQALRPLGILQPVVIRLDDLGLTVSVDAPRARFAPTDAAPDIAMHSESLWFIFRNSFGFDTLTVNGCLLECRPGGFSRAARSLAIENLNNLGLAFGPSLIFAPQVIGAFLKRLVAVSRRLRRA
jgi:L-ascorbate metabolism protein UlaG (beta-lactamase superfamily)